MKNRRYIFLAIVSIYFSWVVSSCISKPEFAIEPAIEFDRISVDRVLDILGNVTDSVTISIRFQDGDGDLGAFTGDTEDNFFVELFQFRNGQFVKFTTPDTSLNFNGVFPDLNAEGTGPIEGTLIYSFPSIRSETYRRLNIPQNDVWKFQVSIKDRAGNVSNTVFTDSIFVNVVQ